MSTSQKTPDWPQLASRRLKRILREARELPAFQKLGLLHATVQLAGSAVMTRLNHRYRGKRRPTDVLSFPTPEIFQKQGQLGELVVCLPVLKRQARDLGHSERLELDILLTHGLLHLLGLDHETGVREARKMARLETLLLERLAGRCPGSGRRKGLIDRTG